MSYFYIPKNYTNLSPSFVCVDASTTDTEDNQTLKVYQSRIETLREKNEFVWAAYRDEYFYYRRVFNIVCDTTPRCLTKFGAIHKSFYVMWELNNIFKFMDTYKTVRRIDTFHFSKCQPGIIQFMNTRRPDSADEHVGIYGDEWRKNTDYLRKHDNIVFNENISYNIVNQDTLNYFCGKYIQRFDMITFLSNDEARDPNPTIPNLTDKDIITIKTIYSLLMQKKGGTLIFSIPEIFDDAYYEILYLVSSCYNKVIVTKPVLIENTNNRKVVICSEYADNYDPYTLINLASNVINKVRERQTTDVRVKIVDCQIPSFFLNKLYEINVIMFQQMIDATMSVINLKGAVNIGEQLEKLNKRTTQKSMFWCIQNNFDYDNGVTGEMGGGPGRVGGRESGDKWDIPRKK